MVTYYGETIGNGQRMNCFEHNDLIAVASCTCGRGLCGPCQSRRQPPTCAPCHASAVSAQIAKTQQRLAINYVFAIAYLILGVAWLTGIMQRSGDNPVIGIASLMMFAWGFLGFRWLLDGALGVTRLAIFASPQSWLIAYLIGSICCSVAGFVLVPYQIVTQRSLLKRLRAEAGTASSPTAALGSAS